MRRYLEKKKLQFLKQKKGWSPEKLSRHDCFVSNLRFILFHISVKMADDLGPMAWSFLPENEQVQYLQKIAQMRRKSIRPQYESENSRKKDEKDEKCGTSIIFCTKCIFSETYWRFQFSGQVSAIGARDEAIFTRIKTKLCGLNRLHRLSARPNKNRINLLNL